MTETTDLVAVGEPSSFFPAAAEMTAALALAERLAMTTFVPSSFRGKPHEVLAAMLTGRELGIGPMQALQTINVIDGRPTASPELMRALIRRAGHELRVEASSTACSVWGKRADTGEEAVATFTLEDAARAGLCQIRDGRAYARSGRGNPLPWETYTEDLLVARATSRLARRLFADVISGVSYTPEELRGIPADVDAGEPDEAAILRRTQKDALLAACSGDVGLARELWGPSTEPLTPEAFDALLEAARARVATTEAESGVVDAEIVEPAASPFDLPEGEDAPAAPAAMATTAQKATIAQLRQQLALEEEPYREQLERLYGVRSAKALTKEQASELIGRLTGRVAEVA